MTKKIINALSIVKDLELFNKEPLYFAGGTALSHYLKHRISEDLDIISPEKLNYRAIKSTMFSLGAKFIQDKNATALRLAGMFPDEEMLKFDLEGVKVEFFHAVHPSQIKIFKSMTFSTYEESKLKIIDINSLAKLKIKAFVDRSKGRDVFDFTEILKNEIVNVEDIIDVFNFHNKADSLEAVENFIKAINQPVVDEAVYLTEENPINIKYDDLKKDLIESFTAFKVNHLYSQIDSEAELIRQNINVYKTKIMQHPTTSSDITH